MIHHVSDYRSKILVSIPKVYINMNILITYLKLKCTWITYIMTKNLIILNEWGIKTKSK